MPESCDTFDELLTRTRQGDELALAELLRRYEPKIRLSTRYLLRPVLRRYLDSIDVTQSVQFHLIRGLRNGRIVLSDPETFVALAVTVVRRKVAQHWRHLQREHRLRFGAGGRARRSGGAGAAARRATRPWRSSTSRTSRRSGGFSTPSSVG